MKTVETFVGVCLILPQHSDDGADFSSLYVESVKSLWMRSCNRELTSVYLDVPAAVDDNDHRKHSSLKVYVSQLGCVCIPRLIPGLVLDPYWFSASPSVCVCVWLDPQFIFTLFVYMDRTVCRGQRGGGSATVNKRRIVRKTGCYLWSPCYTTAVEVKPNWFFLGIASTSLQLNYSNMSESRHPCRQSRVMSQ